jgi:hypothetical protein
VASATSIVAVALFETPTEVIILTISVDEPPDSIVEGLNTAPPKLIVSVIWALLVLLPVPSSIRIEMRTEQQRVSFRMVNPIKFYLISVKVIRASVRILWDTVYCSPL